MDEFTLFDQWVIEHNGTSFKENGTCFNSVDSRILYLFQFAVQWWLVTEEYI